MSGKWVEAPEALNIGSGDSEGTDVYFAGPAVMTRSAFPEEETLIINAQILPDGSGISMTNASLEDRGHQFELDSDISVDGDSISFESGGEFFDIRPIEPDDWELVRPGDTEKSKPVEEISKYVFGKLELEADDDRRSTEADAKGRYESSIDDALEASEKETDGKSWVAYYSTDEGIVKTAVWDKTAFSIVGKPNSQYFDEAVNEMLPYRGMNAEPAWNSYTADSSSTRYRISMRKLTSRERKKLANVYDGWYKPNGE